MECESKYEIANVRSTFASCYYQKSLEKELWKRTPEKKKQNRKK